MPITWNIIDHVKGAKVSTCMCMYMYLYLSVHQDTKLLPFNKTIAVHINLLGRLSIQPKFTCMYTNTRNTNLYKKCKKKDVFIDLHTNTNTRNTKWKMCFLINRVNKVTYKYNKYKFKKYKKKDVYTSLIRSLNLHTNTNTRSTKKKICLPHQQGQ